MYRYRGGRYEVDQREDNGARQNALRRSEDQLLDRHKLDRNRRQHPVFDLPGRTKLHRERQRNRGDPLKNHSYRDEAGNQDGGIADTGDPRFHLLPDPRQHIGEDENEEQRVHHGAGDERSQIPAQDGEIAKDHAPEAGGPATGSAARLGGSARRVTHEGLGR